MQPRRSFRRLSCIRRGMAQRGSDPILQIYEDAKYYTFGLERFLLGLSCKIILSEFCKTFAGLFSAVSTATILSRSYPDRYFRGHLRTCIVAVISGHVDSREPLSPNVQSKTGQTKQNFWFERAVKLNVQFWPKCASSQADTACKLCLSDSENFEVTSSLNSS